MNDDRPDVLMVSSVWRWVHDDMVAGTAGRWPVVWDRATHVPPAPPGRAAWWAPTVHAAKLTAAGVDRAGACLPGRVPRRAVRRT